MNLRSRICLTPTKNESWIIRPFVAANGRWATHLIVADQGSTDGTREFLESAPKVRLVINRMQTFDENHRQTLLLEHARRVEGDRILLGLDADEVLSANALDSPEWARLEQAQPGTILRFRWVNVLPGFEKAWVPPHRIPCGFVDDGSPHEGSRIHSPRVPNPLDAPVVDFEDIVVLHFQYVIWERMLSKQRWYQAWEWTQHRSKGALSIFREYHHMVGSWDSSEIETVRPEWLAGFDRAGVGFRELAKEPVTWWDRDVVEMMRSQGTERMRKLAIWDQDWTAIARQLGYDSLDLSDPRSFTDRLAHMILHRTQHYRASLATRSFEKLLRWTGW